MNETFPSNSTNINVNIGYKGQVIFGKLIEVSSDISQVPDNEIFESANSSISANLNPIRSLSVNVTYNTPQIYLNSNNLTKEEFDRVIKLSEDFFPVSEQMPQQQANSTLINTLNETNLKISQQKQQQQNTKTVFVIMSFNDEYRDSYYVAIQPTLKKLGFEPIRVDEIQHNNTVTKEIIEAIETSAFVVADLTGERPNVYYEVGYAHKADKEVVLLAKKGTAVHFDVAAINRIDYKDFTDLCESLEKRIKAVANRLGIEIEN